MEFLELLWQILAVLAFAGIVLMLVFAIIEPGPLVKKRPFPRRGAARTAGDGDGDGSADSADAGDSSSGGAAG